MYSRYHVLLSGIFSNTSRSYFAPFPHPYLFRLHGVQQLRGDGAALPHELQEGSPGGGVALAPATCFVKSSSALHNFPPIVGFAFNAIISKYPSMRRGGFSCASAATHC